MAPRFLRRAVDRLVQAEADTLAVESFDFQAMRDHADTLYAENQQLHAAITSAVSILDPYGTDPWAYRPGAVPQHAEDIREAVMVLSGVLPDEERTVAEQVARAREIVWSAEERGLSVAALVAELRQVLCAMPGDVESGAAA